MQFHDYTGEVFGKLTVKGWTGFDTAGARIWECSCSCGGSRVCTVKSVKRGIGCPSCNNSTKPRKSNLKVLKCRFCNLEFNSARIDSLYCSIKCKKTAMRRRLGSKAIKPKFCKCGCGIKVKTTEYFPGHYVKPVAESKAVLRKRLKYSSKKGYVRSMLSSNKGRRKRLGAMSDEVKKELLENIPNNCPICNVEINYKEPINKAQDWTIPSFDRLDSTLGYISGNVFIICLRCNTIKNFGTAEEHYRIADYMINKTLSAC